MRFVKELIGEQAQRMEYLRIERSSMATIDNYKTADVIRVRAYLKQLDDAIDFVALQFEELYKPNDSKK